MGPIRLGFVALPRSVLGDSLQLHLFSSIGTLIGGDVRSSVRRWRLLWFWRGLAHDSRLRRWPLTIAEQPDKPAEHCNEGEREKDIGPKHVRIQGGLGWATRVGQQAACLGEDGGWIAYHPQF